jgi:amino acid transporter
MCGGNPQGDAFGFRYWKNPGPMREYLTEGSLGRFAGFWSTFVAAAFAYGGPDYVSLAAAETISPRRVLPSVFKRVIYRLLFFYIGGVLAVGILVSSSSAKCFGPLNSRCPTMIPTSAERPRAEDLRRSSWRPCVWAFRCCRTSSMPCS